MFQVYAIRCKENGKIYIGCTKRSVNERIRNHLAELENHEKLHSTYVGKNETRRRPSPWQMDYDKYGIDAFEFYILESDIPDGKQREAENRWIEEYKSWDERYGYNIRRGTKIEYNYNFQNGLPPKLFDN